MVDSSAAYGASYPALWLQDVRDRWAGQQARANARWGWVKPAEGRGKLIWLRAGASSRSVLLAAELLAAIRHRRQDVRLVLTFEQDLPEIYAPRFKGLRKIAVGYGCCDRPASIQRMVENLKPHGVIAVGDTPGENFLRLLPLLVEHVVLFQQHPMPAMPGVEICYPLNANDLPPGQLFALAADAYTMLVQQQVEPSFAGIVRGEHLDMPLWAMNGIDVTDAPDILAQWQASSLAEQSLLCLTPANWNDAEALHQITQSFGLHSERLSHWRRQAIAPGSIVVVDEARWLAPLSVSVTAQHLLRSEELWQALAGGAVCTASPSLLLPVTVERIADVAGLLASWQGLMQSPFVARQQGDACRKLFWQQRRAAESMLDDLLNRVYEW